MTRKMRKFVIVSFSAYIQGTVLTITNKFNRIPWTNKSAERIEEQP